MKLATGFTAAVIVAALAAGCGESGPEIATVTGTVTMDGKPLPGAQVMFAPHKGRPSIAQTDESGKYKLGYVEGRMGAIPGLCRVEITTFKPAEPNAKGEMMPAVREMVPVTYNRETTLEFDVKPKTANVADFALESQGKVDQPAPNQQ